MNKQTQNVLIAGGIFFLCAILIAGIANVSLTYTLIQQLDRIIVGGDIGGAPYATKGVATKCYWENGGARIVCGSGGEIVVESGATLSIDSGATIESATTDNDFSKLTINGGFGASGGGCTLWENGRIYCDGGGVIGNGLSVTNTLGATTVDVGGGYGHTGCSLSSAGAIECDGAIYNVDTIGSDGIISTSKAFATGDGTVSAPGFKFGSDVNTGLYRVTTDTIGVAAGGANIASIKTAGLDVGGGYGSTGCTLTTDGVIRCADVISSSTALGAPVGTMALPGIRFNTDTDNGFYLAGTNNVALTIGGSNRWDWNASGSSFTGQLNAPDGTAATPIYRFTDDINTGMYRVTTDTLGLAAGGAQALQVDTTGVTIAEYEILTVQSVTPTNGANIGMSASLVNLTPAGAVTPTAAACTNGAWLVLYNANNAAILLQDSGNFVLTGDLTLGQYDTLQLMCIGTKWVQIGPVSAN